MGGLLLQHGLQPGGGGVEVAGAGLGRRKAGLQPGLGRRVVEPHGAELLQQQAALVQPQHGRGQQWQNLGLRMLQFQRAAQFHLGAGQVAAVEQQLAEQETRLGVVGRLLQGILQVDAGGLGVFLGQRAARVADQGRGIGPATASDQGREGHRRGNRCRPALAAHADCIARAHPSIHALPPLQTLVGLATTASASAQYHLQPAGHRRAKP